MPAHSNDTHDTLHTYFWQRIWPFFVQHNFALYTSQNRHIFDHNTASESAICISSPYHAVQQLSSVQQGIDLIFAFKKHIAGVLHTHVSDFKKMESADVSWQVTYVWNYLGKHTERLAYIEYLTQLFWKNQADEVLHHHPEFPAMLASPWKLPLYADSLPYTFAHPVEFFSDKTTAFFQNLEKTMRDWTVSPYFVWHMYGSLQWRVQVNVFEIRGALWQDATGMHHEIQMNVVG